MSDVLVVGGGAAGLMAAITAARHGAAVTLSERNEKVGRKLYITGKGRCNVTNDCTAAEALQNLPQGSKFLYSAMNRFPPEETKRFFTGLGVPLKTERGNRVFPVSDKAADIIDALFFEAKRLGVDIIHSRAEALLLEEGAVTGVRCEDGRELFARQVIVATGGCSYPATGSTGDGYRLARQAGHTVTPVRGSLVPLVERGDTCARMQGLALKNVAIQVKNQKGKTVYRDFGELLFTHFGLSGPMILSASAHLRDFDKNEFSVIIDMKPALDEKTLDERILRDFGENRNRTLQNSLGGLLPRLMIPVVIDRTGIPPETKIHDITKAQRRALLEQLKGFRVDISGPRPVEDAIVTSGGVRLSEVNPATMASKRRSGLYFAGEVLDVDGYTGGFNLQVAWATGYAAGLAAAEQANKREEG
ncbi:MAG: NAD(P)/FAD-dependent oxidoreductase [Clostridiales bacterium]|nr:NAD(P)/FAD-dependent oxidoreductase [Clostridiales bacterium]